MVLDIKNIMQNAIGAFSGVFVIFLLRDTGLQINPKYGLLLGIVWILLLYDPLRNHTKEQNTHFAVSIIISVALTSILSMLFGFITTESFKSFAFFGSMAWLGSLLAIPVAIVFDKKNVNNPLMRYFIRRK